MLIEEIDFVCGSKDKELMYVVTSQMDAMGAHVLVVATTNQLDKVDKQTRRGGRLDIDIRLDVPSATDRFQVLKHHLAMSSHTISEFDLQMIARASSGFVCSDLAQIVRNCHLKALQAGHNSISKTLLEAQILESKPLSI